MSGLHQKHRDLIVLGALCCGMAWSAHAEIFSAKVIAVMDGDTVMVLGEQGRKLKIRLANIDAPEKEQAFGKQSRDSLLQMLGRKRVQIDSRAVDQYGRIIGLVSVDGLDINQAQVKRGYAWAGTGRASSSYADLQDEARQAGLGLWVQADPQAPWQWRKLHPAEPRIELRQQDAQIQADPDNPTVMQCGVKRRCAQMASCAEARFYFSHCGVKSLDANGDGEPCERLCSGAQTVSPQGNL
jgi:micrococcal nuclease